MFNAAASKTTANAPTEVELKLSVSAENIPAIRQWLFSYASLTGKPTVRRLHSRYFDTPDRRLAKLGMSLRLRRVGQQWWQTLKTGASNDKAFSSRSQWEYRVRGSALELAKLKNTALAELGPAGQLRSQLVRVFDTYVRRESWRLQWPDGTAVELAIDTGELRATVQRQVRRERLSEIEIELLTGSADTLFKFASQLAAQCLLVPLPQSKAARGYLLAAPNIELPQAAVLTRLTYTSCATTGHALAKALSAMQAALLSNCAKVAEPDIEYVHQARVALRRMRSALREFAKPMHLKAWRDVDTQLRTLGRALGAARDWDVFCVESQPRLQAWAKAQEDDETKHWSAELQQSCARSAGAAREHLQQFLQQPAYGMTALAVERLCWRITQDAELSTKDKGFECVASAALSRLHKALIKRGERLAQQNSKQLHRLRIQAKRLRYTLDMCASLYAEEAIDMYLQTVSALQDELGKLNDDAVAMALLTQLDPPASVKHHFKARFADKRLKRLPAVACELMKLELAALPWVKYT
jgi:triphosphatase